MSWQLCRSLESSDKYSLLNHLVQVSIHQLADTEPGLDGLARPVQPTEEDRDDERKVITSQSAVLYYCTVQYKLPDAGGEAAGQHGGAAAGGGGGQAGTAHTGIYCSLVCWALYRYSGVQPSALPGRVGQRSGSLPPALGREAGRPRPGTPELATPRPAHTFPSPGAARQLWPSREGAVRAEQPGRPSPATPYSASLENLDPSGQEFLVDAGIKLPTMTSAASLPNLTELGRTGGAGQQLSITRSSSIPDTAGMEGELARFLISNEEMEAYEAEYRAGQPGEAGRERVASPQDPPINRGRAETKQRSPPLPLASKWNDGSVERLAEKWAAKRGSLAGGPGSTGSLQRKVAMEQKLERVKQSVPRRSLGFTPQSAQKRLSLCESSMKERAVGVPGQAGDQARRQSLELEPGSSEEEEEQQAASTTARTEPAPRSGLGRAAITLLV